MSKARSEIKVLLLQARGDEETLEQERGEFVRFAKLDDGQLDTINAFVTHSFDPTIIDGYDALFVGGSSDADVLDREKFPFIQSAEALLAYCADKNVPVLASCYGFQLAVEALGGKVERKKEFSELKGSGDIKLTKEALADELFYDMPETFKAVAFHKDSATILPENLTLLAYSDSCPYHAFKIVGKPFYATQFHSEIDRHDFIERLQRYKSRYIESAEAMDDLIKGTVDMDEVNTLPWKFIDRIVLKNRIMNVE